MKPTVLNALISVTLLALSAGTANAALINTGNSMQDTTTNLEWLDLTETQGMTFNEVAASTLYTVDGWVHATQSQVEAMFLNAGFVSTDNVNNVANDPAAALLLANLGCTQFCNSNFDTGRGFAVGELTLTIRPNYHEGPLGAGAAVLSLGSNVNKDTVYADSGHFLVRALVPVPAAFWLLASALAGTALMRRKSPRG